MRTRIFVLRVICARSQASFASPGLENMRFSAAWIVRHLRKVITPSASALGLVHDDGLAGRRRKNVVRGKHEHVRLHLRLEGERQMHRDLVAVEVGVERRADKRMKLERLALDEYG